MARYALSLKLFVSMAVPQYSLPAATKSECSPWAVGGDGGVACAATPTALTSRPERIIRFRTTGAILEAGSSIPRNIPFVRPFCRRGTGKVLYL